MDDSRETCKYEFGSDENKLLADLSKELLKLGTLVLIGGLLFVTYIIISFLDPPSLFEVSDAGHMILAGVDYCLWILISVLVVYVSIMIIKLAKPIRLIASTAGADIPYLMEFVKNLTIMSRITSVSLIVICVIMAASLVMMVLVF
jgi:hypothetical protein